MNERNTHVTLPRAIVSCWCAEATTSRLFLYTSRKGRDYWKCEVCKFFSMEVGPACLCPGGPPARVWTSKTDENPCRDFWGCDSYRAGIAKTTLPMLQCDTILSDSLFTFLQRLLGLISL